MPFLRQRFFVPLVEMLEDRYVPSNIPLIIVPGQPASFPKDVVDAFQAGDYIQGAVNLDYFITHLGTHPEALTANFTEVLGVGNPYHSLISSMEQAGYTLGVDLFVAAHDWRMPVAPLDYVNDGGLQNVTAASMLSGDFSYGVNYLGHWLSKAVDAWNTNNPGVPLPGVDVISHSEGYPIVRAYVGSPNAYGQDPQLPTIRHWVSLSPPAQGASGIYNLLKNNFLNVLGSDLANGGLYTFVEPAYFAVVNGRTIYGPDGLPQITRADILDAKGKPDPVKFIQMYIPSFRDEMATYAFLDGQTVNDDPNFRNDLLLDLNGPGAPSTAFAAMVDDLTVIYGTQEKTLTSVITVPKWFPLRLELPLLAGVSDLVRWFKPHPWYIDISVAKNGDGLIALESLAPASFVGVANITLLPQNRAGIDHGGTVEDRQIQDIIVGILAPSPLTMTIAASFAPAALTVAPPVVVTTPPPPAPAPAPPAPPVLPPARAVEPASAPIQAVVPSLTHATTRGSSWRSTLRNWTRR